MRDIYTPDEVLAKRSDLPSVTDGGDHYVVDGIRYYKIDQIEVMRSAALRFLAVVTRMEDEAKKKAAQKTKEWELEHAVPLARTMYNAFYKFSNNYREDLTEDEWLKYYEDRDNHVLKWVATASAALKAQEETGAE